MENRIARRHRKKSPFKTLKNVFERTVRSCGKRHGKSARLDMLIYASMIHVIDFNCKQRREIETLLVELIEGVALNHRQLMCELMAIEKYLRCPKERRDISQIFCIMLQFSLIEMVDSNHRNAETVRQYRVTIDLIRRSKFTSTQKEYIRRQITRMRNQSYQRVIKEELERVQKGLDHDCW